MKHILAISACLLVLAAPTLAQRATGTAKNSARPSAKTNVSTILNAAGSVVDSAANSEETAAATSTGNLGLDLQNQLQTALTPQRTSSTVQVLLLLTVLALVPSILVLMTSFTRIVVVLGLLRQAMATQQLPPNQVLLGLALFMTFVVMAPVYNKVHAAAIVPYTEGKLSQTAAMHNAEGEIRKFMINQVEAGGNTDDVYLFLDDKLAGRDNLVWADVPTLTLIPAYVISELKVSFLMGFRIYLPFLIIDMVIASVLISMGMLMLPPVLISLPFKLLLFVLVDGWHLVVKTLMMSFGPS